MTQPPHVRWSDDRADLIGSPRNLQKTRAAYQVGGLGQRATDQSASQPEPPSISANNASQGSGNISAKTASPRSPRTLWADKWQR